MKKLFCVLVAMFFVSGILSAGVINVTSPTAGSSWWINDPTGPIIIQWHETPKDHSNVKIRLYDTSGITKIANISDDTLNDGLFSWVIPANISPGQYIIRVKTLDNQEFAESGIFTIANTIITTFRPRELQGTFILTPDLKISIIPVTGPTTEINKKTLMEFKVDNIGRGTSKETTMRVFMGQTNTDTWVIKPIKPGRFRYKTKQVTPEGVGYIAFAADVDHANNIGDSKRANNYAKYRMIVKGPDLVTCFRDSTRPTLATNETIKAYVKNIGTVRSTPCKLNFYMKSHGTAKINVPALNPGEVFETSRSKKWFTVGNKAIRLTIDSENAVKEENEKNNYVEGSIKVITAFGTKYAVTHYICSNGRTGSTLESVW